MSESSISDECLFCFEDLNKWSVAILNCQHRYHLKCIKKWNNKSKNYYKVCPQCNIDGEIINIESGDESDPETPLNRSSSSLNNSRLNNQRNIEPIICCNIL